MAPSLTQQATDFPHSCPFHALKQKLLSEASGCNLIISAGCFMTPLFQVKSGFYFSFPCSVRKMWVTVVGRVTQLLLAIIFMLPISGLLYFLEFLSVDNSSRGCFWSFRMSHTAHVAHITVHGCEQRRNSIMTAVTLRALVTCS